VVKRRKPDGFVESRPHAHRVAKCQLPIFGQRDGWLLKPYAGRSKWQSVKSPSLSARTL
jgi:hypothetical protein